MNGTIAKSEICKLIRNCSQAANFWYNQWKAHKEREAAVMVGMFAGQLLGLYSALVASNSTDHNMPSDIVEIMKLNTQMWEEVYLPVQATS